MVVPVSLSINHAFQTDLVDTAVHSFDVAKQFETFTSDDALIGGNWVICLRFSILTWSVSLVLVITRITWF